MYASPDLSPDGRKLSLSILRGNNWDVWIYDLERQVATRLTFDEAYDADQVWSPEKVGLMIAGLEVPHVHMHVTPIDTVTDLDFAATVADYEFARQSLAAQVAKTWFLATELKQQVALATETVDILNRLTEIVETKQKVGQVSMQDVYLERMSDSEGGGA